MKGPSLEDKFPYLFTEASRQKIKNVEGKIWNYLFAVCQQPKRWRKTKLFLTSLSKSWHAVDPLLSQLTAESWLMNGHFLTRADHLKFKISNVILFTGPLIEGKLHSADEFPCEMGHGSRWPSKKQKITLELVALSSGFRNWTLLPGNVTAQTTLGEFGVSDRQRELWVVKE